MNINRFKTNANNNNFGNDLRIGLRNENDLISRNNNRKQLLINGDSHGSAVGGRRTPSPPKSRVLLTTHQYNQQLNTSTVKPLLRPMMASITKSCYTGWHNSQDPRSDHLLASGRRTPDCERKLKKLQESGLSAKFATMQLTKSMPLALEEDEDEDMIDLENEVFIDEPNGNQTIELKSSEEFEPEFVSQIRNEVRKLSSQSFGSQSYSQKSGINSDFGNNLLKRKASNSSNPSNGCKSQSNPSIGTKWQQKKPTIPAKRKSKSNENIVIIRDKSSDKQEVMKRDKSVDNLNNKPKDRRSRSSNGRLSSSDKPNDNKLNKSKNESNLHLHRSQSNPNVEQKLNQNDSKSSSNSSLGETSNSARDKSIRKIKVNQKYYQILNCIGHGGSSKVYQVFDPELQITEAIKVVDLSRADEQTVCGYKNEITLLSKLRKCKRVVRMYDYEYQNNGQQLLVVMEKGDSDLNGVLKSFIESEDKRSLDSHLIRFYWQQMLKAVDEIHSYGVVHSDLKPVNFILVAGKLKLIDFGIANAIQANYTSVYKESQIGTINYMAPEALQNRSEVKGKTVIKYNCKADIWSLGCILYNLVYGKTPFHHFNNLFQKANAILDPNQPINYTPIDDLLLLDCMQQCLQRDPNKRPNTNDLLNHRYLTESSQSSKASVEPFDAQNALISQINNLTPNRIRQLSQVLEKLAKK